MSSSLNQRFTPWSLLKFAAPSIVMMVFMSLYTIVDGIFVSRFVGSNALSATNIVYPVLNIAIAFATMLATGGNAIISRYLGEDRPQRVYDRDRADIKIAAVQPELAVRHGLNGGVRRAHHEIGYAERHDASHDLLPRRHRAPRKLERRFIAAQKEEAPRGAQRL